MLEVSTQKVIQAIMDYLYTMDDTDPRIQSLQNDEVKCSIFKEENASFKAFLTGEKRYTLTASAHAWIAELLATICSNNIYDTGTYHQHIEFAKNFNKLFNGMTSLKYRRIGVLSWLADSPEGEEWETLYLLDNVHDQMPLVRYLLNHKIYPSNFKNLLLSERLPIELFNTVPISIWADLPIKLLHAYSTLGNTSAIEALGYRWETLSRDITYKAVISWLKGYVKSYPEVWSLYETIIYEPSKRADSYLRLLNVVENIPTLKMVVFNMLNNSHIDAFILENSVWEIYINPIQNELDRCEMYIPNLIEVYNVVIQAVT